MYLEDNSFRQFNLVEKVDSLHRYRGRQSQESKYFSVPFARLVLHDYTLVGNEVGNPGPHLIIL